jgi:hypothetical protein
MGQPQQDAHGARQAPPDRRVSGRHIREIEADRQHGQGQGAPSRREVKGPAEGDEQRDREKDERGGLPADVTDLPPALERFDAFRPDHELKPPAFPFDLESVRPVDLKVRLEDLSPTTGVLPYVPALQGQDDVARPEPGALGRRARGDPIDDAPPFFRPRRVAEGYAPQNAAVGLKGESAQEQGGDDEHPQRYPAGILQLHDPTLCALFGRRKMALELRTAPFSRKDNSEPAPCQGRIGVGPPYVI